ncbi:MAG TPA: hypothetical protein VNN80_09260 [Polyangiaceae bacterium]|nr:hypothetical protein [Polyangiaceae bacterium]
MSMLFALTPEAAPSAADETRQRTVTREHALIDAIRAGDERLADDVYAALLPVVDAALGRVLGPSCSRHEWLSQRSIEQTIAAISRHPSPWVCKLEAWATASSARLALEALRERGRSRGAGVPVDAMAQVSSAGRAAAAPGSAIDRLRWLLTELPPQQAEAVVLCDVMALAPTEVAVILGVGLEHVQRLVTAGHERLARALC